MGWKKKKGKGDNGRVELNTGRPLVEITNLYVTEEFVVVSGDDDVHGLDGTGERLVHLLRGQLELKQGTVHLFLRERKKKEEKRKKRGETKSNKR